MSDFPCFLGGFEIIDVGYLSRAEARGTFLALAKRVLRLQKLAS
jgi:hypothetical protein